ncbi:hypothetical protein CYMTET_22354 [Cymbomonas tetramitiformis]|uniref:ACT domain-containing protein n=1 Tax=Cymbomonas tetramitiformis TaxID=36881 RepID=A0AAE0G0B3_9CHLO|nr:hypothetical protein CYMTET_22354 [Cymbomonas tetramitiformis]
MVGKSDSFYLFSKVPVQETFRLTFESTTTEDMISFIQSIGTTDNCSFSTEEHPELAALQLTRTPSSIAESEKNGNKGSAQAFRPTLTQSIKRLGTLLPNSDQENMDKTNVIDEMYRYNKLLQQQVKKLEKQLQDAGIEPNSDSEPLSDRDGVALQECFSDSSVSTSMYSWTRVTQPLCAYQHSDMVQVHQTANRGALVKICAQDRVGLVEGVLSVLQSLSLDLEKVDLQTCQGRHVRNVFWIRFPTNTKVDLPPVQSAIQRVLNDLATSEAEP